MNPLYLISLPEPALSIGPGRSSKFNELDDLDEAALVVGARPRSAVTRPPHPLTVRLPDLDAHLEELLANGVRRAEVAPHACLLALDQLVVDPVVRRVAVAIVVELLPLPTVVGPGPGPRAPPPP